MKKNKTKKIKHKSKKNLLIKKTYQKKTKYKTRKKKPYFSSGCWKTCFSKLQDPPCKRRGRNKVQTNKVVKQQGNEVARHEPMKQQMGGG